MIEAEYNTIDIPNVHTTCPECHSVIPAKVVLLVNQRIGTAGNNRVNVNTYPTSEKD